MNTRFEQLVVLWMNSYVGKHANFDSLIEFLSANQLFKGAVITAVLWWFWFCVGDESLVIRNRVNIICSIVGSLAAIVVARALALYLPFRLRPRFDPGLHFRIPAENTQGDFVDWSSFPSDHAVMFTAIAVGIGFVSKRAGLAVFLYFVLAIAFPRVYLGFHYPTDILGGALVGAVVGYAAIQFGRNAAFCSLILQWEHKSPRSFYVMFFLLGFEIATMFESVRGAGLAATHFLGRLIA